MISVADFDRPVTDADLERIGQDWRVTDPLPWFQSYREMPMAIIEENEMPQWKDPEQLWNAAQAMGTNFVRYPAIGWAAHFYGQSAFLPKYPGMLPEEDFFGAVCEYFHARGGKVCAEALVGLQTNHVHTNGFDDAIAADGSAQRHDDTVTIHFEFRTRNLNRASSS